MARIGRFEKSALFLHVKQAAWRSPDPACLPRQAGRYACPSMALEQ